jgi:hypothetical protein
MAILQYLDENSAQFIDDVVQRWGRIVVPFFRNYSKSKTAAHGFGSGFLARFNGKHWLVTALHVLEEALRADACVFNLLGRGIVLEHMAFFPDKPNDLVFAPLEGILMQQGFPAVPAIDLDADNEGTDEFDYHLLMGYPASQNRLDTKFDELDRRLLSITAEKAVDALTVGSGITDAVLFTYDPKHLVDTTFDRAQPPGLHGMSGGPALELRMTRFPGNEYRFYVRLAGVLAEWKKSQRIVVAASASALREAIRRVAHVQS